jgi:hypothetical protein
LAARQDLQVDQKDMYQVISHLSVFIASFLYHIAWIASHKYTHDTAHTTVESFRLVRWRHSTIPLSAFRAGIVVLCSLSGNSGFSDDMYSFAKYIQILFFFLTTTTFTSWTHCQHQYKRNLQHIMSASVVASVMGFLVSNIAQVMFVWTFFYTVSFVDVFHTTRLDTPKIHKS